MSARACSKCGTTRAEINRDRRGDLLCLGCYLGRHADDPDDGVGAGVSCPGCGALRSGRYLHKGRWLCWPCTGLKPLPPPPPPPPDPFRARILDALDRIDPGRFVSIDSDRFVHVCPVCLADVPEYLVVRFHGSAPRADLRCSLGCDERAIAQAIARIRRRR